jgi:hypothetical protein
MSHAAITAALARDDLAGGERLVAFSLASFADRRGLAWPGTPAAAARAGLGRSRFLQSRERLVRLGLLAVVEPTTGRGRSSTVELSFALEGPWWDGDVNAELFEAVLSYSPARGPARLLLAAMAAASDTDGVVSDLSTEMLRRLAGVADRSYRRARAVLLASGEIELLSGVGGRGQTNLWRVVDPRAVNGSAQSRPRRVPPPVGARPLMSTAVPTPATSEEKRPIVTGVSVNDGQDRTLSGQNRPIVTGVSGQKGGQDRTLFAETPARTPAETPAPNARAGSEPQNPRTGHPPSPPQGGTSGDSIVVQETHVTERGRKRRRAVRLELAEVRCRLGLPTPADEDDWQRVRETLLDAVRESTFALWLEPLELIAVGGDQALVVTGPSATLPWLRDRFGWLITACAERNGRQVRLADESETHAMAAAQAAGSTTNRKDASRW